MLRIPALLLLSLACKCNDDTGGDDSPADTAPAGFRPDVVCPGDDACPTATGALQAGAAMEPITPTCYETWEDLDGNGEYSSTSESYYDCGCDHLCEGDDGYPGPDEGEGDGEFQAVWMAGFQNGRPANSVHDDLWARAVVLRQGETSIALVSVDVVGYFNDEVDLVREEAAAAGVGVDHIVVTATHVHEGPDTMGMWGKAVFQSGVDEDYMTYVRAQIVAAVAAAEDNLTDATLRVGVGDSNTTSDTKGSRNTIRDSRDPVIIDQDVNVAWLRDPSGGTIATLVNWGNHPEVLSDENTALTSDFVHYVRESMEDGIDYTSYDVAGKGGVCVYLQGTVGGLMTPLGIEVTDGDGNNYSESNWDKAQALGRVVAEVALDALDNGQDVTDPDLAVRMVRFYMPVDNYGFQAMSLGGVFDRETYNWDDTKDISDTNVPELRTEMDLIDVGPIRMMTVPGELFPEIAVGGYDQSRVGTTADEFIASDNPNPPDISAAPAGPYLKERMGAEYNWVLGLGNDELGYIVPAYDFKVDENSPYLAEPEGDHYEETNSTGPNAAPLVDEHADLLLTWTP